MEPATAPSRAHVVTEFGTLVYRDAASGDLRHGAIDRTPRNIRLDLLPAAGGGGTQASLRHDTGSGWKPILRPFHNVVPGGDGSVTLSADDVQLCAVADGRVTEMHVEAPQLPRFRLASEIGGADHPARLASSLVGYGPGAARYHLGYGAHPLAGYLNIDWQEACETNHVAPVAGVPGAFALNWDLSKGLPGVDNSLDVIYHCHFLEHLGYVDAIKLLQDARFRLRPGGMMRLLVPDIGLWIANYQAGNVAFFAEYRRLALNESPIYQTKAAIFMAMLHNFGHRCGYDFDTIKWLLENIGFTAIRQTGYGTGSLPDLAAIEPRGRFPLRELESLCVECEKPREASPAAWLASKALF